MANRLLAAVRRLLERGDQLAYFTIGWISAGWLALVPHGAAAVLAIGYAAFIGGLVWALLQGD